MNMKDLITLVNGARAHAYEHHRDSEDIIAFANAMTERLIEQAPFEVEREPIHKSFIDMLKDAGFEVHEINLNNFRANLN